MHSPEIEEVLRETALPEEGFAAELTASMNYSLFAGGKRIRPTLMRETYRLFGGDGPEIGPFMAAIELIHTYSLVHDDLPAMDNDTLRRGRTTTWKKFGEAAGILAGDGLLTYAFETACRAFEETRDPGRVGRALGILAQKAGWAGMVGGQSVDVALTGKPLSKEQMAYIYENKTGALIEASMQIGAVLAGAGPEEVAACGRIASAIGLAFQIRDDILDVTSSAEVLGKDIGSDARNEKTTYVTLYGLAAAKEKVRELSDRAVAELSALPGEKSFFEAFIRKMEKREN